MKLFVIVATLLALAIGSPVLAQDAGVDPAITGWADFFNGLWHVVFGWVSGPAVVAFLMAQARAMFPALGNLGVLTVVGDVIAGNWGHAKNAG